MITGTNTSLRESSDVGKPIFWEELYPSLHSFARRLVYSLSVRALKGQEEDLAEDIVQETMRRMLEYSRKAERGEALPIRTPEYFMLIIAANYCRDLKRRDRRLVRGMITDSVMRTETVQNSQVDLQEVAIEHLHLVSLFTRLAKAIIKFPEKQRQALLTDLANRMAFSGQPTALQEIFLTLGVSLQEYQRPPSCDARERARFAALLSTSYKRLCALSCLTHS